MKKKKGREELLMKRIGRLFFGALLLVVLAWAPAVGQSVMDKARKEGKVVWYSSLLLPQAQAICNLFNSKNLGVECVLHRDGSGKLYRRYRQEAKGNIYVADVMHTSNIGHFLVMRDKLKFLEPYKPKGAEKFNPAFITKDNSWTVLRASVLAPVYNTKYVKPEDVPKSWKDFLDPKWKGKLVSGFVTQGMIGMVNLFGWEFYQKMVDQKPKIVQSVGATLTLVERGEAHISVGSPAYQIFGHIKKGEPLAMVLPKEGLPFVPSPSAVLKKAPHPNAARVFTDFLVSLEAQQLMADQGLYVGHPDVKYPKGLAPLKDLKLIELAPEEVGKKSKPIRKKFRELFGA
jgi:iron(III) transport system substrate-binding protein